jgi:hypothetical protein
MAAARSPPRPASATKICVLSTVYAHASSVQDRHSEGPNRKTQFAALSSGGWHDAHRQQGETHTTLGVSGFHTMIWLTVRTLCQIQIRGISDQLQPNLESPLGLVETPLGEIVSSLWRARASTLQQQKRSGSLPRPSRSLR